MAGTSAIAKHLVSAAQLVRTFVLATMCFITSQAFGDEPNELIEASASLRDLFPADQIGTLAQVISAESKVRWTMHVPETSEPMGVLVFVSPSASADPPRSWLKVLDERKLIWVAPQKFGNPAPVRQRILAAMMGLTYVQQHYAVARSRVYIGGMSGGGRVASIAITELPQLFTGALYIVGANFWDETASSRLEQIREKRYVFLTGDRDFNRDDTRNVYKRYLEAGADRSLLIDLPHFGHEYPSGEQLKPAIDFLDADHTSLP